jgi:hypothetical protein
MTNTPKEQALEEELSAALATVAMLEEDGERLDWIQSVLLGLDADCAPDALCAMLVREFPNYTSIRSTLDALRYNLP